MPRANYCGRIHLGPCLVNGGPSGNDYECMTCHMVLNMDERVQISRTWETVHAMLAPYRNKDDA